MQTARHTTSFARPSRVDVLRAFPTPFVRRFISSPRPRVPFDARPVNRPTDRRVHPPAIASQHASFLWKLHDAKMFFNGCEEREVPSLRAGAMRMRSWTGANCVAEDPKNAFGCYWRFDAQAFEGCGCVVARAATCLCDRVADVTVSEYKIDTVSLGELTSLSIGDALNTWRVFAVVGAMFFGSLLLASALHLRATLGKRRLLRCVLLYKNILFTHRSVSTFDRVGPFQLTDELFWNGPHQTSRRPREKSRLGFRRRPTRLDVAH